MYATKYILNGKTVTREEFLRRKARNKGAPSGHRSNCWPMVCEMNGVHPDQIPEASRYLAERGAETDFTPDGSAIWRSREHRKRYCRAMGLYDRNGGYGDASPLNK